MKRKEAVDLSTFSEVLSEELELKVHLDIFIQYCFSKNLSYASKVQW